MEQLMPEEELGVAQVEALEDARNILFEPEAIEILRHFIMRWEQHPNREERYSGTQVAFLMWLYKTFGDELDITYRLCALVNQIEKDPSLNIS